MISYAGFFKTLKGIVMSDEFLVTAEAIDDDVLIRLPEELGVQDGQQFEISRRLDGVVVLKFANDKTVK